MKWQDQEKKCSEERRRYPNEIFCYILFLEENRWLANILSVGSLERWNDGFYGDGDNINVYVGGVWIGESLW